MAFELTTWKHSTEPYAGKFQVLAVITCPGCGHEWILSGKVHKVMADGTVQPSAVCPVEPCGFHKFVKLKDWTPPEWFLGDVMVNMFPQIADDDDVAPGRAGATFLLVVALLLSAVAICWRYGGWGSDH